jgi:hypothetical protein
VTLHTPQMDGLRLQQGEELFFKNSARVFRVTRWQAGRGSGTLQHIASQLASMASCTVSPLRPMSRRGVAGLHLTIAPASCAGNLMQASPHV